MNPKLAALALTPEEAARLLSRGAIREVPIARETPKGKPGRPRNLNPPPVKTCDYCGNPRDKRPKGLKLFCSFECKAARAKDIKLANIETYYNRTGYDNYLEKRRTDAAKKRRAEGKPLRNAGRYVRRKGALHPRHPACPRPQ